MKIHEKRKWLYYQFPQWLFESPYNKLSDKAKLILPLLWDRTSFSEKNGWYDDEDNIFVYYTNEQLSEKIGCSNKSIVKAKKELADVGLIKEVRQGMNKPNIIYVYEPYFGSVETTHQEVSKLHQGSVETTHQEVSKLHTIKNNIINNNISRTNNQEELEDTSYLDIGTPPPAQSSSSDFNLFDYYQERIGVIDGTQMLMLNDYINFDDMEVELVKRAIDKAADNGKRYFNYINKILMGWKQNGITTVVQQDEEQRSWDGRKSSKQKNSQIDEDEARSMQENMDSRK